MLASNKPSEYRVVCRYLANNPRQYTMRWTIQQESPSRYLCHCTRLRALYRLSSKPAPGRVKSSDLREFTYSPGSPGYHQANFPGILHCPKPPKGAGRGHVLQRLALFGRMGNQLLQLPPGTDRGRRLPQRLSPRSAPPPSPRRAGGPRRRPASGRRRSRRGG